MVILIAGASNTGKTLFEQNFVFTKILRKI